MVMKGTEHAWILDAFVLKFYERISQQEHSGKLKVKHTIKRQWTGRCASSFELRYICKKVGKKKSITEQRDMHLFRLT